MRYEYDAQAEYDKMTTVLEGLIEEYADEGFTQRYRNRIYLDA